MRHPRFEYDVDSDVDRQRLERRERNPEGLDPDEFRRKKYGVDGTKIFICQVTPGVFTVKMLGKNHGATDKMAILDVISAGLKERFGL